MAITCNTNGTICTKFFSDTVKSTNSIIGYIIGSVAFLVFVIMITLLIYMLCCKRNIRNKFKNLFQTHREQSTDINFDHQQPSLNSQTNFNEQPPSYQETNMDNNIN